MKLVISRNRMNARANNKDAFSEMRIIALFLMMIAHNVLLAQRATLQRYVLNLQMIRWRS